MTILLKTKEECSRTTVSSKACLSHSSVQHSLNAKNTVWDAPPKTENINRLNHDLQIIRALVEKKHNMHCICDQEAL